MQPHALVIDDDPEILEDVKDRLESLGHTCDTAGCQTTAREHLQTGTYSYILLDLQIPVCYGRKTRIENGMHLLEEIHRTQGLEQVPVIVLTTHGLDGPDLAVSALKKGAVDYVKKTFDRDELSKAIREALAKREQGSSAHDPRAKGPPKKLIPFEAARREMLIYPDRVTVCGVEVWKDCAQSDLRRALEFLSKKDRDGFARIRSTKLDEILDRDDSNPISRRVKDFRDRASKVLMEEGYECGPLDILAGGHGGYRFTEWMDVRVVGSKAQDEPAAHGREPAHEPDEPAREPGDEPLNERQRWILGQIDKGERLRIKDIAGHTGKNRSTVNRDLKELRRRGLIALHGEGHYVRAEKAQGKGVTPSVAGIGPRR